MSGYERKQINFNNAIIRLKEGISKYREEDDMHRDALIQRFEFTFELAWKTLKALFENEGLIGLNSPKTVLKEALSAGLIDDEAIWLSMLDDRNSTARIYDEHLAAEICENIRKRYGTALDQLAVKIRERAR